MTLAAILRWESKFGEDWLDFLGPGERDKIKIFWSVYFAYDPKAADDDDSFNEWNKRISMPAVFNAFTSMVGFAVDVVPLAEE